ncbi:hypothetical protein ACFXJ5_35420 [Streptomyces sp. NPDC059373]
MSGGSTGWTQKGGGRAQTINDEVREYICLIARTCPADWKIAAFSSWSLSQLTDHVVKEKVTVAISREALRRILGAGKISWKTTTTWKASTDPEFMARMHRVLALYDTPPADGRAVCVDEFGPVRRPRRLRATYNRYNGVTHMLAALDLTTGKLHYRVRPRKRWQEFLELLKALRPAGPGRSCTWSWTTSRPGRSWRTRRRMGRTGRRPR